MTLLALIAAFLLDHFRPLTARHAGIMLFRSYAAVLAEQLAGRERYQALVAWLIALVPVVAVAWGVHHLLAGFSSVLALVWDVLILYATLGYRRSVTAFAAVEDALMRGDEAQARALLSDWRNEPADDLSAEEAARLAIEQGLLSAHRGGFAIVAAFVLLPGPVGPLLYRLAELLKDAWSADAPSDSARRRVAAEAFAFIDWIPARLTGGSFAVMGDFEDAVYCWNSQASHWLEPGDGIVLASGAGAAGVRVGESYHREGALYYRPELGVGDTADPEQMASVRVLLRRTLYFWAGVVVLFSAGRWIGA
ncbi:MAG TPA: regulatory signaling modulator protein AmpE, partial [Pelomicrobium sp.]|nr:regulatory signaling modulator protein AmpE [Pelomicrobium sp.]